RRADVSRRLRSRVDCRRESAEGRRLGYRRCGAATGGVRHQDPARARERRCDVGHHPARAAAGDADHGRGESDPRPGSARDDPARANLVGRARLGRRQRRCARSADARGARARRDRSRALMLKTFTLVLVATILGGTGHVLLAKGMRSVGDLTEAGGDRVVAMIGRAIGSPWLLIGVALQAAFFLMYLTLLSRADVSLVLPMTAPGLTRVTTYSACASALRGLSPSGCSDQKTQRSPVRVSARPMAAFTMPHGGLK